jgi:signal transduction histidine kinase
MPSPSSVTVTTAMSPEQLARIFERFYRADTARGAFDGAGSGLGLTIALAIVRDHGGDLSATSAGHGRGAVFTLALPLAQDAPALTSLRTSGTTPRGVEASP